MVLYVGSFFPRFGNFYFKELVFDVKVAAACIDIEVHDFALYATGGVYSFIMVPKPRDTERPMPIKSGNRQLHVNSPVNDSILFPLKFVNVCLNFPLSSMVSLSFLSHMPMSLKKDSRLPVSMASRNFDFSSGDFSLLNFM